MTFTAEGLARRIGERTLFRDVDLRLEPGETVVVRGPSGSGKSELLRTLAWLREPDAGTLRLDGRTPAQWGAPAWRARVSYVPQSPPAVLRTPAQAAERVASLAERPEAPDDPRALAAEWGLADGTWDQPWSELSGGERQRAWLAIVLARKPAVLLLDEPTSALDAEAAGAVEASLGPRTKVWVTHDAEQAARLDAPVLRLSDAR